VGAQSPTIIGRNQEVAQIETLLATTTGASTLVIEGSTGIGKTTLLRAAVARAAERGHRALSFQAAEAERDFGLAALGGLLGPVIDEVLPRLPSAQARAIEVAIFRSPAEDSTLGPHLVSAAFTSVLRELAIPQPVVLAIDDLQWIDAPSAQALEYAFRRLRDAPVTMMASLRTDEGLSPLAGLERALGESAWRIDLGPLTLGALHRLLHSRFQLVFPRRVLVQIRRASGGNPLYAIEIARAVLKGGIESAGERMLAVPAGLRSLLQERVAALSREDRSLLMIVRALSFPTERTVVAALGGGPRGQARLSACLQAGLVEMAGETVQPFHPLLTSVAYADATEQERRRLHRRLASIVGDAEEAARHLALASAGPDARVAAALEGAAGKARARGAASTAAELGALAVRLTPPAEAADLLRRNFALALDEYRSGDSGPAQRRWKEIACAPAVPPLERARAFWLLAELHVSQQIEEIIQFLKQALAEAGDDVDMRARAHAGLAEMLLYAGRATEASSHARAAASLSEVSSDVATRAIVAALTALATFAVGGGISPQLEGAVRDEDFLEELPIESVPSTYRAFLLMWARDDLSAARDALRQSLSRAQARGDEVTLPIVDIQLCELEAWAGRWDNAETYAEEAAAAIELVGTPHLRGYSLWARALVPALRGEALEARELAMAALELDEQRGVVAVSGRSRALLGFIELSEGRADDAVEWLLPLHSAVAQGGHLEPFFFIFVPDLVESLVSLGRSTEAREILAPFAETAGRLQRRWALALAARCSALIDAASGRPHEAIGQAGAAVNGLEGLEMPFELARARLVLGTVQRRAKRRAESRRSLEAALREFEVVGARLWAARTMAMLERTVGASGERWAFSDVEQRVADLAAIGRTNREIAATLFVSEKTVEWNLARIYRKVGVRSRTELSARLAGLAGPWTLIRQSKLQGEG
jgi:DNA-binding CsgD family transcriptional regulator/2-oxo-4-hydroxy-4-carboxy--5-ureidoimidazoline (OHCU) decarboxylase